MLCYIYHKIVCKTELCLPNAICRKLILATAFHVRCDCLKLREVIFMTIRAERPTDRDTVYRVVQKAFETAEQSDGNEQDLVNVL